MATLAASVLTLFSISCASLSLWRVGADLALAGDFVFRDGILSHWQVWAGAAIAIQYCAWQLTRYAKKAVTAEPVVSAEEARDQVQAPAYNPPAASFPQA